MMSKKIKRVWKRCKNYNSLYISMLHIKKVWPHRRIGRSVFVRIILSCLVETMHRSVSDSTQWTAGGTKPLCIDPIRIAKNIIPVIMAAMDIQKVIRPNDPALAQSSLVTALFVIPFNRYHIFIAYWKELTDSYDHRTETIGSTSIEALGHFDFNFWWGYGYVESCSNIGVIIYLQYQVYFDNW